MPICSRWTVEIPEISLPSLLFTSPTHSLSDEPAFLDASSPSTKYLTLASCRLWSQRFAAGLRESGLQDADRVLLLSGNSIFFPVVFMGVIMAGGIFTGANPTFVAGELAFQLKDSDPLFLICATTCLDIGCEAASRAGLPKNQIFVFDDAPITGHVGNSHSGCRHWSNLLSSEVEGRAFHWNELSLPNECHKTMALNYSSGTTGLPKGVEITHYNYVAHTLQIEHLENLPADSALRKGLDRWLCFLPMYHAMAQAFFISLALRRGIPVFIMPQYNYIKMLDCVQNFGITRLVLVPPVLVTMAKDPRIKRGDWDLSSVSQISCGAAPLSREIIEEIETRWVGNDALVEKSGKVGVTQGYGMTELTCGVMMTPRGASIPSPKPQPLPFTESSFVDEHFLMDVSFSTHPPPVGELLANCSAKIMNEDTSAEVPQGARGELWIRGPIVMKGYWRNDSATKAMVTEDGWLMTGDICTVDENNYFSIVDRKKELIKIRAYQVAPAELEALLLTHPSILDAAVIATLIAGEPHPRAYIVVRPGCAVLDDGADVVAFVRARAARVKWITGGVRCVKAIPRNQAGKVLRRVLREMEMGERERERGVRGKL